MDCVFSVFREKVMADKGIVSQPRPFIGNSVSNNWSSGICDCTQDLPQCKWIQSYIEQGIEMFYRMVIRRGGQCWVPLCYQVETMSITDLGGGNADRWRRSAGVMQWHLSNAENDLSWRHLRQQRSMKSRWTTF